MKILNTVVYENNGERYRNSLRMCLFAKSLPKCQFGWLINSLCKLKYVLQKVHNSYLSLL